MPGISSQGNFSWKNNSKEEKDVHSMIMFIVSLYIKFLNRIMKITNFWTTGEWGKYIHIHLHVFPSNYFLLKLWFLFCFVFLQLKSWATYNFVYLAVLVKVAKNWKQLSCPGGRQLCILRSMTLLEYFAAIPSNHCEVSLG